MSDIWNQLKRRNVVRVGVLYAIVAWVLAQIVVLLETALNLPDWFDAAIIIILLIGFPIALLLAWAFELTPNGFQPTPENAGAAPKDQSKARTLNGAIIGGLLIAVAVLLFREFSPSEIKLDKIVAAQTDPSIAVMPFADLSPSGDQEYFADGISEELLNLLAKQGDLQVAGRTSSFAYKGRNEDLRDIGAALDVANILEGSVRKSGDRVRVTAQLIKVDDGFHLWSETYDRDLTDIFAVQDDISNAIMTELLPLIAGITGEIRSDRTDIDAFEKYLEARDYIHQRDFAGMQKAVTLLEEVTETDPDYAPAHGALAKALLLTSNLPSMYGEVPFRDIQPRIERAFETALRIDPGSSDALAAKGLYQESTGAPEAAIQTLERAYALDPGNMDAGLWLAQRLTSSRDADRGAALIERLFTRDPLFGPIGSNYIGTLILADDMSQAQKAIDRLEAIAPGSDSVLRSKLRLANWTGQLVDRVRYSEALYQQTGDFGAYGTMMNAYFNIDDPESIRAATTKSYAGFADWVKTGPASVIPRLEANDAETAIPGNTARLVWAYVDAGAYERALETFNDLAPSFADYAQAQRDPADQTAQIFGPLAYAAQQVRDQNAFEEILSLYEAHIEWSESFGARAALRDRALLATLRGDYDDAVRCLSDEVERSKYITPFQLRNKIFEPLYDRPNFIALAQANTDYINTARAELGRPLLKSWRSSETVTSE